MSEIKTLKENYRRIEGNLCKQDTNNYIYIYIGVVNLTIHRHD